MNARTIVSNMIVALPLLGGATYFAVQWIDSSDPAPASVGMELRPGTRVPSIPLRAADGSVVLLSSALTDRDALVLIVDPRCPHCHTELEAIEAIGAESPEPLSVEVLVVSVGDEDGTAGLRRRYAATMVYHDAERALVEEYGLDVVPVLAVVDGGGIIQSVDVGWTGEERLRELMVRSESGTDRVEGAPPPIRGANPASRLREISAATRKDG